MSLQTSHITECQSSFQKSQRGMSPDKTGSHKNRCHALSNDVATVWKHNLETKQSKSSFTVMWESQVL